MAQKLHFKTNTLLKNLVGKDLINDDNIAIIELVKNSYDARSDSVEIRFEGFSKDGLTTETSRLVIADEGSGMDEEDIQHKWLNIAYSEKKYAPREHGAFYAGNKGVGRFSCDRLGQQLDMLTRTKSGKVQHLSIDWKDFEIENERDLTIQKISVSLSSITQGEAEKISRMPMPQHGTILVISKLRSVWDREKLLSMKSMLERFINPNQLFSREKFTIDIVASELKASDKGKPDSEQVNGVVQNKIFKNLKFNSTFITSEISEDGRSIKTTLHHEGEPVFKLKEKNFSYTFLKTTKITIYYLNPYKKAYFKRQTGVRSIDFGSIFLFLNGFRVAPYGERGNDWLGLDIRKSQGAQKYLASREVIGRIEVVDTEDQFQPVSSREGLKNTLAFAELKNDYFLDVLRKLERFVADGLGWDSVPAHLRASVKTDAGLDWKDTREEYTESWDKKKQRIALSIMAFVGTDPKNVISFWFNPSLLEGLHEQRAEELKGVLGQLDEFSNKQLDPGLQASLTNLSKLLTQKDEEARKAREEATELKVAISEQAGHIADLNKQASEYRAQTLFLQSVSSLDVKNLMAFHHQIFLDSTIIDNHLSTIVTAVRENAPKEQILALLEKLSKANRRVLAVAQFATKANFKAGTKKEPTDIPAFVEQYLNNVARDFIATNIAVDVKNSIKEPFEIKASKIELSMLLDNLISNSTKAEARKMHVALSKKSENILQISIIDDGIGLSPDIKDPNSIFELGVTTTTGSGIGLYHVKQMVAEMGGSVQVRPLKPRGIEIRMELPR